MVPVSLQAPGKSCISDRSRRDDPRTDKETLGDDPETRGNLGGHRASPAIGCQGGSWRDSAPSAEIFSGARTLEAQGSRRRID